MRQISVVQLVIHRIYSVRVKQEHAPLMPEAYVPS